MASPPGATGSLRHIIVFHATVYTVVPYIAYIFRIIKYQLMTKRTEICGKITQPQQLLKIETNF
jgi:hypothetical protein